MNDDDIFVKDSIVIEFGLGKVGIFITKLTPKEETNINARPIHALTIESYDTVNPIGMDVTAITSLNRTKKDVILAFHTIESISNLKEHLDELIQSYMENDNDNK